jgi:hypothetical protein
MRFAMKQPQSGEFNARSKRGELGYANETRWHNFLNTLCMFLLITRNYLPLLSLLVLSACGEKVFITKSPPGYDLNKPEVAKLPLELDEISGLAYYQKDSSIFAIADDTRAIYKIKSDLSILQWKFKGGADFEDLVAVDSSFYLLQSTGDIKEVSFSEVGLVNEAYKFPKEYGKGEFEILYSDTMAHQLVLVCKDCKVDNNKTLSTFTFNTLTKQYADSSYKINVRDIQLDKEAGASRFKPSAAAIHPITQDLYIISAVNNCLVVTDAKGGFKEVYFLTKKLFKQPEGLTFSPNGDMYISNEFAASGRSQILKYVYKSANKK